jgi:GNAT superfamily N-acetyltransferase
MATATQQFAQLNADALSQVFALEQAAMNTDTTYPLSKEELQSSFTRGDVFFGLWLKEPVPILVAKVGFTAANGPTNYELDIAVHPDHQGKGLGRAIMQKSIESLLKLCPSAAIFLYVHPDNARAIRLYRSQGFVERPERVTTSHGPRIIMDYAGSSSGTS